MRRFFLIALILTFCAVRTGAETPSLPVVEEVEWGPFRDHCLHLLQTLDKAESPLPAERVQHLRRLLERNSEDQGATSAEVQKLLDGSCLIAVSINAESRVKAARGPAEVRLLLNRPTLVLVKVHNEGGVTHALRLYGQELVRDGERDAGCWLEAVLVTESPSAPELTGRRLEYRVLRLTPRQSGKREATFQFDVGQGTQDLGFRAEVPILFSIHRSDASPKRR
ncbi:MAG TPA: hypothetical protein VH592_01455 [Gemmataceae bacterium]|jgi:hypothetical protein